ncbi:MAG: DUF3137 domain-containing protein [Acidobacteriota bacterium]
MPGVSRLPEAVHAILADAEERRLAAREVVRQRQWIGFALVLVVWLACVPFVIAGDGVRIAALIVGLVAAIAALSWSQAPAVEYKKAYKERVLPALAGSFGTFQYEAEGSIPASTVERFGILPSHDRASGEDYFSGSYKGVGLEFSEATLKEERGSGKNKRWVTVFRGVLVRLQMNKRFVGETILRRDSGSVGNFFSGLFQRTERIRLEDPHFEELFEVFGSDQVEARYLLTPAFMQRLVDLCNTLGSDKIAGVFFAETLFLAIPHGKGKTKDLFEPPAFSKPADDPGEALRLMAEIEAILGVVDALQLDQRTGV